MPLRRPQIRNEQNYTKKEVKRLLNEYDWFWWSPPANGFGKSGVSDIHAVRPGVFMVIETKYGGNKPTNNQHGFLNSIRVAGHFALVVSDKNLDAFAIFLRHFNEGAAYVMRGEVVPVEIGGPMLDALKLLTDYPG